MSAFALLIIVQSYREQESKTRSSVGCGGAQCVQSTRPGVKARYCGTSGIQKHMWLCRWQNLPQDIYFAFPPGIKYQIHLSPLKKQKHWK